jgi:hypothetical protein
MQNAYAQTTPRQRALPAAAPALFRPGWFGRLVRAASLPGGIPPGRSRPEPSGQRR